MSIYFDTIKDTLPDKPSALIRLALEDLEKIENDPEHYTVDMSDWYQRSPYTGRCTVCLAGAVMAKSLNAASSNWTYIMASHYPEQILRKLVALDYFRVGMVKEGASRCGFTLPQSSQLSFIDITHYPDNPKTFKTDMLQLADKLETLDL